MNGTLAGGNIPDEQITASINVHRAALGLPLSTPQEQRIIPGLTLLLPIRESLEFRPGNVNPPTHCLGLRRLKPRLLCVWEVQKP